MEFENKCHRHDNLIYFHKEVLVDSLEGHPMHILTVTGNNAVSTVQMLGNDRINSGDHIPERGLYK